MGCALILASHVPSGCSSSAEARALGFTLTWIVLTGARAAGCSSHGRGGHMLAPLEDHLRTAHQERVHRPDLVRVLLL